MAQQIAEKNFGNQDSSGSMQSNNQENVNNNPGQCDEGSAMEDSESLRFYLVCQHGEYMRRECAPGTLFCPHMSICCDFDTEYSHEDLEDTMDEVTPIRVEYADLPGSIGMHGGMDDAGDEAQCADGAAMATSQSSRLYMICEHGRYIQRECAPGTSFCEHMSVCCVSDADLMMDDSDVSYTAGNNHMQGRMSSARESYKKGGMMDAGRGASTPPYSNAKPADSRHSVRMSAISGIRRMSSKGGKTTMGKTYRGEVEMSASEPVQYRKNMEDDNVITLIIKLGDKETMTGGQSKDNMANFFTRYMQ